MSFDEIRLPNKNEAAGNKGEAVHMPTDEQMQRAQEIVRNSPLLTRDSHTKEIMERGGVASLPDGSEVSLDLESFLRWREQFLMSYRELGPDAFKAVIAEPNPKDIEDFMQTVH